MERSICKMPDQAAVLSNNVFVHPDDPLLFQNCSSAETVHVRVDVGDRENALVSKVQPHSAVPIGNVALAAHHRQQLEIGGDTNGRARVKRFQEAGVRDVKHLVVRISFLLPQPPKSTNKVNNRTITINAAELRGSMWGTCDGIIVRPAQYCALKLETCPRTLKAVFAFDDGGSRWWRIRRGETAVAFEVDASEPGLIIDNDAESARQLFHRNRLNFQEMGIGGLDQQFEEMLRRAFNSRVFMETSKRAGVKHVKGILLHGPPGTGKTLIARQIGKMLNGKEPKVVNGPEVLNKYVGQSEENVRALFAEAEQESLKRGDASDLHVIIFDEIDAICKQRGVGREGGANDSIVNQLLTKMDGVNALNNILVIGMTNRKDLLDEALLRPGRFEVHVHVGLPDEDGRLQILRIHTDRLARNGFMDDDVDLEHIATNTRNYSGAELEGVVHAAWGHALSRCIDYADLAGTRGADERGDVACVGGATRAQPRRRRPPHTRHGGRPHDDPAHARAPRRPIGISAIGVVPARRRAGRGQNGDGRENRIRRRAVSVR